MITPSYLRFVFIFLFAGGNGLLIAQATWPIRDLVLQEFSSRKEVPMKISFQKTNRDDTDEKTFSIPEADWYQMLSANKANTVSVELPVDDKSMTLDLIYADLDCHYFTENGSTMIPNVQVPLTYQGIIRDEDRKNNVILTVSASGLSMTVYAPDQSFAVLKDQAVSHDRFVTQYKILPADQNPSNRVSDICGTIDKNMQPKEHIERDSRAPGDYCIYVFVECFDSMWAWRDSNTLLTIEAVYELFNHVNAAFTNEQLKVKVSHINIWTHADPFLSSTREEALWSLAAYYQDNYWGNICVGLDFSTVLNGRSGLAGDIGRVKGTYPNVCPMYTPQEHTFCYNDLNYDVNVQDFPSGPISTTQDMVYLVTHEIGHLLGSSHTQWCGWPLPGGGTGALDNCATVEPPGGCPPGADPPPGGGTIMSYCVNGAESTSFNNGFGTLPGDAIRNFVDGNSCLTLCPYCLGSEIDLNEITVPQIVYNYENNAEFEATGILQPSEMAVLDAMDKVKLKAPLKIEQGATFKVFNDGCSGIR